MLNYVLLMRIQFPPSTAVYVLLVISFSYYVRAPWLVQSVTELMAVRREVSSPFLLRPT